LGVDLDKINKWIDDFSLWLSNFSDYILNLFVDFGVTLFNMLKDLFYWFFDLLVGFAVSALSVLDLSFLSNFVLSNYINALPPETLALLSAIKISTCLDIIISAIFIRLTLQLIPFTRLGS